MRTIEKSLKVADEAWLGLALLHREHPERESFSAREILDRVRTEGLSSELRPGIQAHIYLHNVANLEANSARYRMFYKLANDTYRLVRPGDQVHPSRKGKVTPARDDLSEQYHDLLNWYEQTYCAVSNAPAREEDDPVLQMAGVGKEIWADVDADEYVRGLRSNWYGEKSNDK
jgi:hypothetical protein